MTPSTLKLSLLLAWRSIWRHKRRTWLTASAIAFGSVLVIFMLCINFGAYAIIIDLSLKVFPGHAQVQAVGYQDRPQINNTIESADRLARRLGQSGHYKAITIRGQAFALASSASRSYGASVVGVRPDTEKRVSMIPGQIISGRYLADSESPEAVIGAVLARNLRISPGDELTLLGAAKDGSVAATILNVVGIFESGSRDIDRYFIEMPIKAFSETFAMGDSAHSIVVLGEDPQRQTAMLEQLKRDVADENLAVLGWEQLIPGLKQGLEVDRIGDWIFMAILMLIIIFSIFNTFLMSILERTREFGLMLALGSRPSRITGTVMLESFLLTVIGLAFGIIVGTLLVLYLAQVGIHIAGIEEVAQQYNLPITRIYPQVNVINIIAGPLIILVVTNLVAWLPLWRIHRLQPVDAMRTV